MICAAKKSSKLKDMLAQEDQKPPKGIAKEPEKEDGNCKKCSSGFHKGFIDSMRFEYRDQHGWMTSKEAELKCENDLACGGFTFYGVDVPSRKHFVYFVHFIPFEDMREPLYESELLWTFYRTHKKIIVLPGKPHIMHRKIKNIQLTEELKGGNLSEIKSWPYKDLLSFTFKKDGSEIIGQKRFQFSDHNFKESQWQTVIRNENLKLSGEKNNIVDGSTWSLHRSCRPYEKPLENINLRFHPELHSNIKVLNCHEIDKEQFEQSYVRKKIPVIIKGCEASVDGIEDILWDGSVLIDNQQQNLQMLTHNQVEKLNKNQAVLNIQGKINGVSIKENFLPEDLEGNEDTSTAAIKTKGKGQILGWEEKHDSINFQVSGTKWWVIIPPGCLGLPMHCVWDYLSYKEQNFHWKASAWFDSIQPQLYFTNFYGRPVIHAMQKPGDIIYLPSNSKFSSYAVEDSLEITKLMTTVGTLDESPLDVTKLDDPLDKAVARQRNQLSREWEEIVGNQQGLNFATMFN